MCNACMPFKMASPIFNGEQNVTLGQNTSTERKTMLYTIVNFTHGLYEVWIIFDLGAC